MARMFYAYVITNNNIDVVNIKEYLAKSLPQYMIPSYIHNIDKIPLTDNGKVDLKALPELKKSLIVKVNTCRRGMI